MKLLIIERENEVDVVLMPVPDDYSDDFVAEALGFDSAESLNRLATFSTHSVISVSLERELYNIGEYRPFTG